MATQHSSSSGQQGQVKDPEHDGRLKENRDRGISKESPEGEGGGSHASGRSGGGGSHASGSADHSGDHGHTPGAVRDPEHDGRLKENRDRGVSMENQEGERGRSAGSSHASGSHASGSHSSGSSRASGDDNHTPGAVKDPEHDGRLKENRDRGIHKGDR